MAERYTAAVLDPDACFGQLEQETGPVLLTLAPVASAEELLSSVVVNEPDLVLLDIELPRQSIWNLAERLRKARPEMPIFMLSTNPDWSFLELDPLIEMVRRPYDPKEVLQRVFRLLRRISQADRPSKHRLPHLVVDELRSQNGRIDAKRVAKMFGISIPVLAHIIKAGEPALYKTPDAHSIQSKLINFERIAWGLLRLTGSDRGLRIWLNAPNPELDNDLPIDYIKEGHIDDIAAMVEDALLGHPS
ncbi:MAG: antitoxin Xre/MbcA/ParS toxin-binding domain-containing protein [Vulcanimicrobiota bacterium]